MKYYPSPLENWVSQFYSRLSINTADDINEQTICYLLRIYYFKKPLKSFAYEQCNYKSITIDNRIPAEEQREVFFHELSHLLRHSGWQLKEMPLSFKELQEWDANRFVPYAAIPFHLLQEIDLQQADIISVLADTFKVTPELCERRLTRIYEKANMIAL